MIPAPADVRPNTSTLLPLHEYDYVIVSFSAGKDSMACALHLLDLGVPANRIELWHQSVDGRPGVAERFFDWPCTESYCQAFASAFGFRMLFQWKEGGFQGEMLRNQRPTAPTSFQLLDGREMTAGGKGPLGTRMMFPQVTADLSKRWCSAYLKIDVATKVFSNDPRFEGKRAVMITGERRQESGNRSRYADVDAHKSTTKNRRVDQWRSVLGWEETEIWRIIERYRVRPHPAYYLGWSRVSCLSCIFGNPDQWAAVRDVAPALFVKIHNYEHQFGKTIRRDGDVGYAADKGASYILPGMQDHAELAMSEPYPPQMIIVPPNEPWQMPAGAFGHSGGPI